MPVTNVKKQGVITGVKELYVSVMTTEESGSTAPVYDTVIYRIPILKEITVTVPQEDSVFYASNDIYSASTFITEAELSVTTMKLDAEVYNKVLGIEMTTDGVATVKGGSINRPYVAVGFAVTTHNGEQQAYWFPKTQWKIPEASASTQEDSMSEQNTEFSIMAYPLSTNKDLYYVADSEVTASKVDFDAFFSTVPTDASDIALVTP